MKHLIVGAGATLAEALALGNSKEICPPLIRDFARKTWANYNPHPYLEEFLHQLGCQELGSDPRSLFFELEEKGVTNIERFMEFVWGNRNANFPVNTPLPPGYISGLHIRTPGNTDDVPLTFWDNFLYHGIGNALSFYLIQCFHENGVGWRNLDLTKSVAARLEPGDLVLNLNYDTIFELALRQLGLAFRYAPGPSKEDEVVVCKPHGSLNMVVNATRFTFGQPEWLGIPEPKDFRSFSGLIPPRLNKSYDEHPIARMILDSVRNRRPSHLAMWGVGLTESDTDFVALYSSWARHAGGSVDVINPLKEVADKARGLLKCEVRHFTDVAGWLAATD